MYTSLSYHGYTWYHTKKSGTKCILHFLEKTLKNVDISVTIPQNMVRKLHNFYLLWLKLTYYTKKNR